MPIDVLPHEPENHCQIAPVPREPPVKLIVDDPPVHICEDVEITEFTGSEFNISTTEVLTQFVVIHAPSALTQ